MAQKSVVSFVCLLPLLAFADDHVAKPFRGSCPANVSASITKAFVGGKAVTCEVERGQVEVTLTRKEGDVIEVDVALDGSILQVEAVVGLPALPTAVTAAFAKKYGGATITRAEKQTNTARGVFFELAFTVAGQKKEATFAADGTFVDEE
jgi:hypothetical protein